MRAGLAAAIVDAIAADGYAVVEDAVAPEVVAALRECALALDARGELVTAGVGRGAQRFLRDHIRGDRIRWLDDSQPTNAERCVWQLLADLRAALNHELMLGLWRFEGHYALYPPGAVYARHRDRFRDDDARVLSCVLYLNDGWRDDDGGALRLHLPTGGARDVLPLGGTFVTFLADRFEHEVRAARRPRLSLTGWFRRCERSFA